MYLEDYGQWTKIYPPGIASYWVPGHKDFDFVNDASVDAYHYYTDGECTDRFYRNASSGSYKRLGLIHNELIKVEPMPLPSGLVFFLDYTYGLKGKDEENK